MKIIAARLVDNPNFANLPFVQLLVEGMPSIDDFVYEEKNGFYFGELDGVVSFFFYKTPGQGFGGTTFSLKMTDGSVRELHGPWSSNSTAVHAAGFPESINVSIAENEEDFRSGNGFYASHITKTMFVEQVLPLLRKEVEYIQLIDLVLNNETGSIERNALHVLTECTHDFEIVETEFEFRGTLRKTYHLRWMEDGQIKTGFYQNGRCPICGKKIIIENGGGTWREASMRDLILLYGFVSE